MGKRLQRSRLLLAREIRSICAVIFLRVTLLGMYIQEKVPSANHPSGVVLRSDVRCSGQVTPPPPLRSVLFAPPLPLSLVRAYLPTRKLSGIFLVREVDSY